MATDISPLSYPGEISWYFDRINYGAMTLIAPSGIVHSTGTHSQSRGYLRGWTWSGSLRSMSITSTLEASSGIYSGGQKMGYFNKTSTASSYHASGTCQDTGLDRESWGQLRCDPMWGQPNVETWQIPPSHILPRGDHCQFLPWCQWVNSQSMDPRGPTLYE